MEFEVKNEEKGYTEIDFGNNRDNQGFYQFAKKLETILQIKYTQKKDNFNTLHWGYYYQDVQFILHYDWHIGTKIFLRSKQNASEHETAVLTDLVKQLEKYS